VSLDKRFAVWEWKLGEVLVTAPCQALPGRVTTLGASQVVVPEYNPLLAVDQYRQTRLRPGIRLPAERLVGVP
jgi:hypothetical protein